MRWHRICFALALLALALASGSAAAEDPVLKLDEDFVRTSLALSPSAATAQGYHEDHGAILDELLDDDSPAGVDTLRQFYRKALRRTEQLAKHDLTREQDADLAVIRSQCELGLLDIDQMQSYRHNPTVYVEMIGNAIYSPLILNYAEESKRMGQITTRIEKIPAALAIAKQNLASAPPIWTKVAQEENQGNIELIDNTIRAKVPPQLKSRYTAAAGEALEALRQFNQFLKGDLSRRTCDWRLGPKLYAAKFRLALATGDTPELALANAEAKLRAIREDMRKQAVAVYPKFFPGQTPPAGGNAVIARVLDKIALQHTTAEHYFEDAERDLAEATQFVREKKLLLLPAKSNLKVIPTPEFMRGGYGVGGFSSAPALEPQLGSYYWITPLTTEMSAPRIESKLREYNFYGLKILTIHEAMPGHYVQFEHASQVEPKWRGVLRSIFSNTPYVEGWAVYATELLIAEGYQNTPEMRLTFGKQMLRVVANTILDIKLQTKGMTDAQAIKLMIEDTFQEKEEAEQKLQRAKLSSCQLPTYFVGWRGWDRLRAAAEKKGGFGFQLSAFHERALEEGAVALPVLDKILRQ